MVLASRRMGFISIDTVNSDTNEPKFLVWQCGRSVFRVGDADSCRRRQGANPGLHASELELEVELVGGARLPRCRLLLAVVQALLLARVRKQEKMREWGEERVELCCRKTLLVPRIA